MKILDSKPYSQDDGSPFASGENEQCFTGIGNNAAEAYEDAVEVAKEQGVVYTFPKRPSGIRKADKLTAQEMVEGCVWQVVIAIPTKLAA